MKNDIDWYVFTAPKTGRYKISGVYDISSAEYGSVGVNAYSGYTEIFNSYIYYGNGYTNTFKGTLKKKEKIYLKVSKPYYYNIFYKLKVQQY